MTQRNTAIIGLGNPCMTDEGIGIEIVNRLTDDPALQEVQIMDLGTGGLTLLHALEGLTHVLFVDCAYMDSPAGTLRCFDRGDVQSRKIQPRHSLHEADVIEVLNLAERMNTCPAHTRIIGIQPASVEPGTACTPELTARLDSYVETTRQELLNLLEVTAC